ncbi:hypothetical protein E2562_017991 [Oryza meyeriana var. granulata]|uniref:Peptidase A1 domain-containing protein n=1 Tax=Oryza meyeriana var. granulata TaxID=110450 RepID=A0A6G1F955_9ORYZ|nr:hypothetical protein E2562_017991 [Oryza meyeriana var. granulata]
MVDSAHLLIARHKRGRCCGGDGNGALSPPLFCSYYTMRLYIGTPLHEFMLTMDSRSTVTYIPCATCEQCGNHQY